MKIGYIKLYRQSLESIIFTNEKGWKIWTWCLLKANHEENSFFLGRNKMSLKPGQFVMGRNTASGELGMAVGTIWYWLDILEKEGNIERKATNKYTVITLPKWKQYQEDNNKPERRLNADRTQIEQQIEPNKNDKNEKNEKNFLKEGAKTPNPSIDGLMNFFKDQLGTSLDESIKTNRQYCHLLLNRFKKDYPTKDPIKAIQVTIQIGLRDNFHTKNLTSFKYLFYNAGKILQGYKGNTGKVILR